MKRIIDALAPIAIMALLLGFAFFDILESYGGTVTTNLSNTAEVRGWRREELTYNSESNTFSREEFPSAVEASAARQVAAEIPALYTAATNTLITNLAPATAAIAQKRLQPVIMLTGAASLDNLLDRENLTMAVVSNEVTRTASGKHIKAYVALNKNLVSEPVMKARLYTPSTSGGVDDTWVSAEWTNYTNTIPLTLIHPQSYTNFVVATVTNEQTVVLTTNVEFSVIEDAYRREIVTNDTPISSAAYIQNGLILHLDAIENAGVGVHDDAATVWKDLSGYDNDFTLSSNAGWTSNQLVRTSGSSYLASRAYLTQTIQHTDITAELLSNGANQSVAIFSAGSYLVLAGNRTQDYDYNGILSGLNSASSGDTVIQINKTLNASVNNVGVSYGYYNDYWGTGSAATIGGRNTGSAYPSQAKYYAIRLYNRVLTDEEREQNYEFDKWRYIDRHGNTGTYRTISTNYVHYCVTNSETRAITLTNQVIVVTDGTIPRIVTAGDRETLECHILEFDVPNSSISTNLSTGVQRWVKIGDPETGFDYGNRVLRVNGTRTLTMTNFPYGDFYTTSGTALTNFNFFVDNGIFKVSEKKKEE